MCTRQEMTGRYCSPHGERKNVLAGEEGVVVAENDIGRRSGEEQGRGSARRQRTGTWSKRSSMSNGCITREGKESERERGREGERESDSESPSPVAALPAAEEQRRWHWRNWSSSVGGNVCECETEVTRVLPDLSTSREGRRGSGRGVAAGGLAIHGRQALREMGEEKRKENWGREWAR
jgi:hypothetical protein